MKVSWASVGGNGAPVHETQQSYLEKTTCSWGGAPKVPQLPMGPQPTPFVITTSGNGGR